jgi:hypothetical protein
MPELYTEPSLLAMQLGLGRWVLEFKKKIVALYFWYFLEQVRAKHVRTGGFRSTPRRDGARF